MNNIFTSNFFYLRQFGPVAKGHHRSSHGKYAPTSRSEKAACKGSSTGSHGIGQPCSGKACEILRWDTQIVVRQSSNADGSKKFTNSFNSWVQYVSTFNRLKGSQESTEQTVNRWIQALHSVDFGISFLVWRLFFYAKDLSSNVYEKAGRKGNGWSFIRLN